MSRRKHGRAGIMANMHDNPTNIWEYLVSIIFSISSLIWAHATNSDGMFFKMAIVPFIGGTIGYFTVKFWKFVLKDEAK
jgi:hypothetical protein